jgi:hypothetical protein
MMLIMRTSAYGKIFTFFRLLIKFNESFKGDEMLEQKYRIYDNKLNEMIIAN